MSFTALANITLTSTQTVVTFSSIPNTYRDLYLVLTRAGLGTGGQPLIKVNNDAGTNYNGTVLRSNGSTANGVNINAYNYGATLGLYPQYTGNNDLFYDIWMPDYATTDKHKNLMIRANDAGYAGGGYGGVEMNISKWNNTSAITSLVLYFTQAGLTFGVGTTMALYGVSA
jgi:hypothetical protein